MSWQSWACNELNQAATHPSPYANVHKGNMCTMGGSIGFTNLWQPYVQDIREKHVNMVKTYLDSLPNTLSEKGRHEKKLAFMADNGIRQLGKPRIGIFSDGVMPDPPHCEINAWHLLDLIYSESVQRGLFDKFVKTLSAPVRLEAVSEGGTNGVDGTTESEVLSATEGQIAGSDAGVKEVSGLVDQLVGLDGSGCGFSIDCEMGRSGELDTDISPGMRRQFSMLELEKSAADNMDNILKDSASTLLPCGTSIYGCGLAFLSSKVLEHYNDEAKRFNKLSTWLIGKQAISLAQHSYRLVDCLKAEEETEGERLKRLALSNLFNKIHVNSPGEIDQLEEFCQLYFNILVLFSL